MVLQTNPFSKASMGTCAKLYFSVLNQCNLKCNCCFLVQKWKMSYEAMFGGNRRHAWCHRALPLLPPPPLQPHRLKALYRIYRSIYILNNHITDANIFLAHSRSSINVCGRKEQRKEGRKKGKERGREKRKKKMNE